jgi:hypothetical protein
VSWHRAWQIGYSSGRTFASFSVEVFPHTHNFPAGLFSVEVFPALHTRRVSQYLQFSSLRKGAEYHCDPRHATIQGILLAGEGLGLQLCKKVVPLVNQVRLQFRHKWASRIFSLPVIGLQNITFFCALHCIGRLLFCRCFASTRPLFRCLHFVQLIPN